MSSVSSPRAVLASAVTANFAQFGTRVVIGPFVLVIATEFAVTTAEIGVVLTMLWVAYALFQFPSGVLADRFGERRVILIALSLTVLGSSLVAVAPSLPTFALAAVVLGIGTGLYFVVGSALLSRRFERTGLALGVHSAGGPLSGLVLPVVATAVAATHGWRLGVAVGAAVAAVALVLVIVGIGPTPPSNPEARFRDRLSVDAVWDVLSRPSVAFTTLIGIMMMYAFQSFVSFYPAFLQAHHGLTEGDSAILYGLAFVLIAGGLPLVGEVADRTHFDVGIAVPMVVAAAGIGLVIAPSVGPRIAVAPASVVAGSVAIGLGVTWGGALQARSMSLFESTERGTGFGLMRTTYGLFGASGNVITGWLATVAGWPVALGVVAAVLLAGTVLVVANHALDAGL